MLEIKIEPLRKGHVFNGQMKANGEKRDPSAVGLVLILNDGIHKRSDTYVLFGNRHVDVDLTAITKQTKKCSIYTKLEMQAVIFT